MTFKTFFRAAFTVALLFALGACGIGDTSSEHADHEVAGARDDHGESEAGDAHDDHDESEASSTNEERGNTVKLTVQEIKTEGIRVDNIRPRTVSQTITVTAVINANQDRLAHVAPRVAGRIVKVTANLGENVKTGQRLAVLDSSDVGEAHTNYLQARSDLDVARADFERAKKLQSEQIIAQKEYLRIRGAFERAAAASRATEDRLRILGVEPPSPQSKKAVSVFSLRSPFTGTVIEKHAILGELANPEKSLFTVADLSTLWIEANIYEADLAKIVPGNAAEVRVAAYADSVFRGTVTYISDVMDPMTRTVKARIELPNPEKKLKPQMFATAHIDTSTQREVMAVPANAVTLIDGKPSVFVREHDVFEVRQVETGDRLGKVVVISGGIAPEDQVVIDGTFALKARMLKSALGEGHAH